MSRTLVIALALSLSSTIALAAGQEVEINAVSAEGVGKSLGSVSISESNGGVSLKVSVSGVADGDHGFHVHEKGDCGPAMKDGKPVAAQAAGPHFDPKGTKSHKGPGGGGHDGDLPKLVATAGKIDQTVTIEGIKLDDIAGRSLMIHEGGDNYSDSPENGGGGPRIACGVIPK